MATYPCGFVEEGRLREHVWSGSAGRYVDLVYMGILRREWAAAGEVLAAAE